MKSSSLDFYATVRSLYRQKRRKDISGEMEDENLSMNIISVDVYDEPELKVEVEKIVKTDFEVKKTPISYKNSLPSSNYPEYNEFGILYKLVMRSICKLIFLCFLVSPFTLYSEDNLNKSKIFIEKLGQEVMGKVSNPTITDSQRHNNF